MVDKMECFYTAQNIITSNIDNENNITIMEYSAELERSKIWNAEMPPRPTLKTVDIDDIMLLAENIARYAEDIDSNPSLLTE